MRNTRPTYDTNNKSYTKKIDGCNYHIVGDPYGINLHVFQEFNGREMKILKMKLVPSDLEGVFNDS